MPRSSEPDARAASRNTPTAQAASTVTQNTISDKRATPEEELYGRAAIVEERRAMIDEVADRQIAEQDLPAPHQVEEVIVGQEREAAVGVVETQQPGEAE